MATTEIILQINRPDDLSLLISFLEKSGIAFQQRIKKPIGTSRSTGTIKPSHKNTSLGKHIGSMPTLNTEAFEQHLHQMRSEWERDTF